MILSIVARPYDQEKCRILGEFTSMMGRSISSFIAHLTG